MNAIAESTTRQLEMFQNETTEIVQLHGELEGLARTSLEKAIRIGELLTTIKAGLKHGQWLPFVETLPFSQQTCSRYARLFEERSKLLTVSNLTDAYRALSQPVEEEVFGEPELDVFKNGGDPRPFTKDTDKLHAWEVENIKKYPHLQPYPQKSYQEAAESPLPHPTKENPLRKEPRRAEFITLENWNELSERDQAKALELREEHKAQFNYQDGDNIEWARYSWNPVTGCNHPCKYCYARDIANRFYPQKFAPALLPEKFAAPHQTKVKPLVLDEKADPIDRMGHRNVFTCSMADLFGKWVPAEWIETVLQHCAANPQWNFLFLTKFPIRMAEFSFPENAWVGTSVDKQSAVKRAEDAFEKIDAKVKWISCEPMMERLTFNRLDLFDWVVIGGASRSSQTPEFKPPFEWIVHLWEQSKTASAKVYFKTNLLGDRVREYPI